MSDEVEISTYNIRQVYGLCPKILLDTLQLHLPCLLSCKRKQSLQTPSEAMRPNFYQIEEAVTLSQYCLDALFSLAYEGKVAICLRCSEHFAPSITPGYLALFDKIDRLISSEELANAAYVKFLMDAHYSFEHGNRYGTIQRKTGYQPLSY